MKRITLFCLVIFCLLAFYVYAQTEHNESNQAFISSINQTLREQGIYAFCMSRRTGRWVADKGSVVPPEGWSFECIKNLGVRWQPTEVNGSPAVLYRVVYMTRPSNPVILETTDLSIALPITDPEYFEIYVEAMDELGNGVFIDYELI